MAWLPRSKKLEIIRFESILEEILCPEDITNKRRRRHRDSTVTVAVGSSLGKNHLDI